MSDNGAIKARLAAARWRFVKSCLSLVLRCTWPLAVCALMALFLWISLGGLGSGRFRRAEFEAVVAHIRAMGLKEGEECYMRIDDFAHPENLRRCDSSTAIDGSTAADGSSSHWLVATVEGKSLTVVIVTADMGHAGLYGFAYSDRKFTPSKSSNYDEFLEEFSPMPGVRKRIDDHWWEVYNNML